MNAAAVVLANAAELVNAADAAIGQHKRTSLQSPLTRILSTACHF